MTPKEKAQDLVDKFYWVFGDGYLGSYHKQCALIAVDEILILITAIDGTEYWQQYYEQVKKEIEKL
jgi:hypothetical protein